jgi:hypothetical protein
MTPNKQVSPAIRILRGERDASARATHLEAATRKFLVTTNERKYMSTKTNFKRIALVAVAALGLGVLSSVPSQAAPIGTTITVGASAGATLLTSTTVSSDTTTGAFFTVQSLLQATGDSTSVTFVKKSEPAGSTVAARMIYIDTVGSTVARVAIAANASAGTDATRLSQSESTTAGTAWFINASTANNYAGGTFNISLESATETAKAGTYTYTVIATNYTGPTASATQYTADVSIVVGNSTALSTTASSVKSFVDLKSTGRTNSATDSSDDVITAVSTVSSTNAGFIYVGNRNSSDAATLAVDSLTATVTGAGVICATSDATPAVSPTVTVCGKQLLNLAITGDYQFVARGDGTSGVSTINVTTTKSGMNVTKSITYYASAAKTITATVGHPLLKVGTNNGSVRGTAVDAAGTNFTGGMWIVASSAADALIAGSTTPVTCGSYSATDLRYNCPVDAIATGTAKFKLIDASTVALATATSNEVTVTVTNTAPATVKLSFDKTSYAPNERARIYVTPLDADGKEIQSITGDLLAAGGISVNGSVSYTGSTTTADSLTVIALTTSGSSSSVTGAKAGSVMYTVYMPASGGTVTITATGGSALPAEGRVALTATATVTDSGAAALAAVTALATQVASLRTLITTLTNLVLKIQKKVKA